MPRFIRASEIGDYVFCHRAWWLRQIEQRLPDNVEQLRRGSVAHTRHGLAVSASTWLLRGGLLLLAAGLIGLVLTR